MDINRVRTVYGWLINIANNPNCMTFPVALPDIQSIKNGLIKISHDIEKESPYFSQNLFEDGHYANAAEDAFVEINDRVKKLFMKVNPTAPKVPDGYTAMNMVFSDNAPLLEFCDRSTETGSNIQKGYMQMLAGAMSALRNPKAHANITITKDDAMRRLMFASMLMYKIDEAVKYSGIME